MTPIIIILKAVTNF